MSATFFIGDCHFGHKKVTQFRPWPTVEEHDAELMRRWQSVVRQQDTVYVVGDCAFGTAALDKFGWLAGTKKLVMGNHDTTATATYLKYFSRVIGCAEINNWLVTHIPVHESQFARWPLNIHGHTHANKINDPRYFCVSAEQIDYTPITVEQIIARAPHPGSDERATGETK